MAHKSLLFTAISLVAALSFAATSSALRDSAPGLRENLQAKSLPTVALSDADTITASNSIGAELATAFGIDKASFETARLVTVTSRGPLYLIPGTSGACLILDGGSSCGDPGRSNHPILALATSDPVTGTWVGGGITDDATTAVSVRDHKGRAVVVSSLRGTFAIDAAAGLDNQGGAQFTPKGQ